MTTLRLKVVGNSAIEVGRIVIRPDSSHLFAALLLLAESAGQFVTRQSLQDMLYPHATTKIAQRTRQLLYRLRKLGVPLEEIEGRLRLMQREAIDPCASLAEMAAQDRLDLTTADLAVLPGVSAVTPAFSHWLEEFRDRVTARCHSLLATELGIARDRHAWYKVLDIASLLLARDSHVDEAARAYSEALVQLGRRQEAIDWLDALLRRSDSELIDTRAIRSLRERVFRQDIVRNEPTLRGRDAVLEFLSRHWRRLSATGGCVCLLTGPAGIGKTRVAEAFARSTSLGKARIVKHVCEANDARYPLALFSHILPQLQAMRGSIGAQPRFREALQRLVPNVEIATSIQSNADADAKVRAALSDAIIDLIEAVASEGELLLVIDDAHYLDEASRSILAKLTRLESHAPVMVVACSRPRTIATEFTGSPRAFTCAILPLTDTDARRLLIELGAGSFTKAKFEHCLNAAGGNPFFLRVLATFDYPSPGAEEVPMDISALAATTYHALTAPVQLALDAVLLLGPQATLDRVSVASGLDGQSLATALRELEGLDLVSSTGRSLSGPHALLGGAIKSLMPSSVRALLHQRIARALEADLEGRGYSTSVALSAAEHWVAAGDEAAGGDLLLRCANQAAALGEPEAALELLCGVTIDAIPVALRRKLLDACIVFGASCGRRDTVSECLRSRLALAIESSEPATIQRSLELQIIEADILRGADLQTAIRPLSIVLAKPESDRRARAAAVENLLIIADAQYDSELAARAVDHLPSLECDKSSAVGIQELRAWLVYHTTFGQVCEADRLADEIIDRCPKVSEHAEERRARRFAAYSRYRFRQSDSARRIALTDWSDLRRMGERSDAMYVASLLTELAVADGDWTEAEHWFAKTAEMLQAEAPHRLSPNSGYHSSAAIIALMSGRYADAEAHIRVPKDEYARLRSPRYEAIASALQIKIQIMRGDGTIKPELVRRLECLYEAGKRFGGQDTLVEALWSTRITGGQPMEASRLLQEYWTKHRREPGRAEWSLRHTTAADPAWELLDGR